MPGAEFRLTRDEFLTVVERAPLVSIDLLVHDTHGRVLIGLRNNHPAKDWWFVPGGVVMKDEKLDRAFSRIAHRELGLDLERADASLDGVHEHFYETNFAGEPGVTTHYVVLAYRLQFDPETPPARSDDQHRELRWVTPSELLAMDDVHPNTRVYFG